MDDRRSSSPTPGFDPAVMAGLFLSLAAVIGFAVWGSSTSGEPGAEHPLAFAPIQVDQDRLSRARDTQYREARKALESSPAKELVGLVRQLNALQFGGETAEQRKLARRISYTANDVIPITGYDSFIAAGEPTFERCATGLDTLLSDLRTGDIGLEQAKTDPPADTYAAYRRNCGNLLPTLIERNLVDASGHWTEPVDLTRTIVDILQRYRWADIIRSRRPPLQQLTDYERRLLTRWRIESSDAYPLEQRRAYLSTLEDNPDLMPDYDITLARAKLAYAANNLERAHEILKSHAGEQSHGGGRYGRALHWLEKRLDAPGAGSHSGGEQPTG